MAKDIHIHSRLLAAVFILVDFSPLLNLPFEWNEIDERKGTKEERTKN